MGHELSIAGKMHNGKDEVFSDMGVVENDRYSILFELGRRADARMHEYLGCFEGTGRKNHLVPCFDLFSIDRSSVKSTLCTAVSVRTSTSFRL